MEQNLTLLIYIHAFFGGISPDILSIVLKKGSYSHKKVGLYSYTETLFSAKRASPQ